MESLEFAKLVSSMTASLPRGTRCMRAVIVDQNAKIVHLNVPSTPEPFLNGQERAIVTSLKQGRTNLAMIYVDISNQIDSPQLLQTFSLVPMESSKVVSRPLSDAQKAALKFTAQEANNRKQLNSHLAKFISPHIQSNKNN